MLHLNKNDPLYRMLVQELEGKPVLFDIWLDAMDELAEEPDCAQILRERGLRAKDVLNEAERYRTDFRTRLTSFGLSPEKTFSLCTSLFSLTQMDQSPQLLRLYCEILSDPGFLLGEDPEPDFDEDKTNDEEQMILQYLSFCQEYDNVYKLLTQRRELAEKLAQATKIRNPQPVSCDTERSYEIAKCFAGIFDLPSNGNSDILLENLSNYIQIAASSPELKAIEPLLLFRLLTKHRSRMCTVPDLCVRFTSLWKRDSNQIDRDNGRNFKQCRLDLHLFQRICQIYRTDEAVNLPLCWYGLDQVTVLGDFYREHISLGWAYADCDSDFPFIPVTEDLVEELLFGCTEYSYGENILVKAGDVTHRELSKFQETSHPLIARALEEISDYMNRNAFDLALRASQANNEGIRHLCQEILEKSEIKYQPDSIQETELFLAAINDGLIQCQSGVADYLLAQTGHVLLGEPTEIAEWPE